MNSLARVAGEKVFGGRTLGAVPMSTPASFKKFFLINSLPKSVLNMFKFGLGNFAR